jgi:two-component system response regulator WspF
VTIDTIRRLASNDLDSAPIGGGTPEPAPSAPERLVVIGASAGGPTALATILGDLPRDFAAAIVIVQHMDAQFLPLLATWLNERSGVPVRVARQGDPPVARAALLAGTADHLVCLKSQALGYTPEPLECVHRPSVDVFFESVARNWRGDVTGVLLTGMGNDGARGLKALRDHGRYTIAQDRRSSAVYGMPKAAAAIDAAVDILSLERIASTLQGVLTGSRRPASP